MQNNLNKPYIVCTTIIILIVLLLPICIYTIYTKSKVEHYSNDLFDAIKKGEENYSWNQLRVGERSTDCYKLEGKDCLKYSNCGLCAKDGKLQCIPGDEQGPLFKEDCQGWIYTNYYDNRIFGEKVTSITQPWNTFYSDYESRYPSLKSTLTLQ